MARRWSACWPRSAGTAPPAAPSWTSSRVTTSSPACCCCTTCIRWTWRPGCWARWRRAGPYLKSHGGNVELVAIDGVGVVRLRMQGSCHGCPSSAVTLKLAIEQAIHEAAPDVSAILVEGQAEPHPAAAVLAALQASGGLDGHGRRGHASGRMCPTSAGSRTGPPAGWMSAGGRCSSAGWRRACTPTAPAARSATPISAPPRWRAARSRCPGCGLAYDVVQAGRALARPDLHLDPFPILTRNGRTQVALPPPRVAAGLGLTMSLARRGARRRVRGPPAVRQAAHAGGAMRPLRRGGRADPRPSDRPGGAAPGLRLRRVRRALQRPGWYQVQAGAARRDRARRAHHQRRRSGKRSGCRSTWRSSTTARRRDGWWPVIPARRGRPSRCWSWRPGRKSEESTRCSTTCSRTCRRCWSTGCARGDGPQRLLHRADRPVLPAGRHHPDCTGRDSPGARAVWEEIDRFFGDLRRVARPARQGIRA